jgi:hypothetical protein
MTRNNVIRMAREAGAADVTSNGWTSWIGTQSTEFLERFAKLVAEAERRECVIACEGVEQATESQSWVVANCVEAILERGKI